MQTSRCFKQGVCAQHGQIPASRARASMQMTFIQIRLTWHDLAQKCLKHLCSERRDHNHQWISAILRPRNYHPAHQTIRSLRGALASNRTKRCLTQNGVGPCHYQGGNGRGPERSHLWRGCFLRPREETYM
jgi:hypothetical protein